MVSGLGKIVRFHRHISGLSRNELARLTGVGKSVIYDIEHGKESVQLDTLTKIFKVLNIAIKLESPLMKRYKEQNEKS